MTEMETEQLPTTDELERRMEAAWRDLTAVELATRPGNVQKAERAYERYVAALDTYMRYVAECHVAGAQVEVNER